MSDTLNLAVGMDVYGSSKPCVAVLTVSRRHLADLEEDSQRIFSVLGIRRMALLCGKIGKVLPRDRFAAAMAEFGQSWEDAFREAGYCGLSSRVASALRGLTYGQNDCPEVVLEEIEVLVKTTPEWEAAFEFRWRAHDPRGDRKYETVLIPFDEVLGKRSVAS